MKRALLVLGVAVGLVATAVGSGNYPPLSLGAQQTGSIVANEQTVEVITTLPITVTFTDISSTRVTGIAARDCPDGCSGSVRIRWVNLNRETSIFLSDTNPEVPFTMENGDVDKRGGHNLYSELPQP